MMRGFKFPSPHHHPQLHLTDKLSSLVTELKLGFGLSFNSPTSYRRQPSLISTLASRYKQSHRNFFSHYYFYPVLHFAFPSTFPPLQLLVFSTQRKFIFFGAHSTFHHSYHMEMKAGKNLEILFQGSCPSPYENFYIFIQEM